MRLLIHDYAGHPFQAQLSRELARRNHTVIHAYAGNLLTLGECWPDAGLGILKGNACRASAAIIIAFVRGSTIMPCHG